MTPDARHWVRQGTTLFLDAAGNLTETEYDGASLLPGWTRRHLVAHVAANGDALGNLVHWAATGEVTPMYASAGERAAGIERGVSMTAAELTGWARHSATALDEAMGRLTDQQWRAEVVTAQGRTVPATEIPWMRAREVFVHAVDLDRGIGFADLPAQFLETLVSDIRTKRGLSPSALPRGPLADVAAWLAGRPHTLADAPELGPWL
ncbi:maleylpyruvate isomerase family mycothiol-dependent enzyme [Amycolatopsis pithecellobii]|uniref:Maleylpyruvate isomerase family mycothiol-dependent enzyme n=1 Tax=Amycolatopsis pithecellobii TaxID=664692 RepID=A0A6N7YME4_9PSEU|nr:maleylpyruvate isomerase family mycothiol-dependent enzyme [Amycolatopsis pithecellobii]MTD53202.1 maleylpyruvate isomerase family mycothiol-dependent enzyme [Amycolatopsis pithecellobii]